MIRQIVAACDRNGVIGFQRGLPWHRKLRSDMDRFVHLTEDGTVIMFGETYDSIPRKFRPLVNRKNIVVSEKRDFSEEEAIMARSPEQALELSRDDEKVSMIGGQQNYEWALTLPEFDTLHLTVVDAEFRGDRFFPKLDPALWAIAKTHEARRADPEDLDPRPNHFGYAFVEYRRTDGDWVPPKILTNANNARLESYKPELIRCQEEGQCPFCEGGHTLSEQIRLGETENWILCESKVPYKGTRCQALLFPKRHLTRIPEITGADWDEAMYLLGGYIRVRHIEAGEIFSRDGNTDHTGATVAHVHLNYAVPEIVNGVAAFIQVGFGPYPKPA